jgi:uncharacterized protein YqgC (DUF456 family)
MAWLYFTLLLGIDLIGLILAAFTLPGLWLMLGAAAIYAWITHGYYLSFQTLIALLILAVTAEIMELVFGGAGAKKAGASGWGIAGGLLGAIIGGIFLTPLIPIPILGTIIGICLGSFAGAFAVELFLGQPITQSLKIGFGAAKGRLTGIIGKIAIGVVMFLLTIVAGFPIHGPRATTAKAKLTNQPATYPAVTTTIAP